MSAKLSEKTNNKEEGEKDVICKVDEERMHIISHLRSCYNNTKDINIKYDLTKCIEIIQGKENQEYKDLKGVLYSVLEEKEMLLQENCNLLCELDTIKKNDVN